MTQCSFAGSKIPILQQVQLRGRNEKTHKKTWSEIKVRPILTCWGLFQTKLFCDRNAVALYGEK